MSLTVVVLLAAVVVGRLRGGRLTGLAELRLRRTGLLAAALGAQLVGTVLGGAAHAVGLVAGAGLVTVWLAAHRGVRGTGLVALGLGANALVVGLNGAMPVDLQAAGVAGVDLTRVLDGADPRHELAGPGTRLLLLSDVVPVPLPVRPEVVSPGDVLLAAGLGQLVVAAMTSTHRAAPPTVAARGGAGSTAPASGGSRTGTPRPGRRVRRGATKGTATPRPALDGRLAPSSVQAGARQG